MISCSSDRSLERFSCSTKSTFGKAERIADNSKVKYKEFGFESTVVIELLFGLRASLSSKSRVSSNLRFALDVEDSKQSGCSFFKWLDNCPAVLKGLGQKGHVDFTRQKFIIVHMFVVTNVRFVIVFVIHGRTG
jgi:hypothetical protein